MSDYTLPDLDWDYGALEPHISGAINELRRKHHATYVKGANDTLTTRKRRDAISAASSGLGTRRRWPSTWPATPTTSCGGRSCRRKAATSRPASWPRGDRRGVRLFFDKFKAQLTPCPTRSRATAGRALLGHPIGKTLVLARQLQRHNKT